MIGLATAVGFTTTRTEDPGVVGFRMALDQPDETGAVGFGASPACSGSASASANTRR
jgi:acetyltransferase